MHTRIGTRRPLALGLLIAIAFATGHARPAAACSEDGPGDGKPLHTLRLPAGAPSQAQSSGLTLVSHLPVVHAVDEVVSDVWKLGDTVMLGYRCGGDGSTLVDVADPLNPRIVAWTEALPNLFSDDVTALHMNGPVWSGDLFIEPFDNCGGSAAPARTRLWDIGDPAHPKLLSELVTYSGVHNAYPIVRPDGTFLLLALPRGDTASVGVKGGFGIADITDPRRPEVVGVFNLRAELGDVAGTDFLHDVWADESGMVAYLSWWDAGLVRLDISDPANPRLMDRFVYYADQEWYGPAAGNTHTAVPSVDGRYVYLADEDFSPGRIQVDAGRRDTLDPTPEPVVSDERGPDQSADVWGFARILDLRAPRGPAVVANITTTNTALLPPRDSGWYSVHNLYEWAGRLFLSSYSDGIRMLDVTHKDAPVETGYFVPPDLPDRRGRPMKTLVWGVFVDDGYVYASDIAHGLWILSIDDAVAVPTATAIAEPTTEPTVAEPTQTDIPTDVPTHTAEPTVAEPTQTTDPTETEALPTTEEPPTGTAEPPTPPAEATATAFATAVPTPTTIPTSVPDVPTESTRPYVVYLPLVLPGRATSVASVTSTIGRLVAGVPDRTAAVGVPERTASVGEDVLDVGPGETVILSGEQTFRTVRVRSGGTIATDPYAGPGSAGGSLIIRARLIDVDAGGAIRADGAGFRGRVEADGEGPGGGAGGNAALKAARLSGLLHFTGAGAGGGFGGRGGDGMFDKPRGQWKGGRPYGDATAFDLTWGSAGGAPPKSHHETVSLPGGNGGGALMLEADTILIEGEVSSDGAEGAHAEYDSAGGGSGGTVAVKAGNLRVGGSISANGGIGGKGWEIGGAGGGGRIKIAFARGVVPAGGAVANPGNGPCPNESDSPYGCPGTVHIQATGQAFLPSLANEACGPAGLALVVVVDASGSMAAGEHGSTALQRALNAARAVLGSMTSRDRASVVTFTDSAHRLTELVSPGEAASTLDSIRVGEGSRLDLGVLEAVGTLRGSRPGEVRRIIVISDGVAEAADSLALDAAAQSARDAGALIYALGFGSPVHSASLLELAGRPDRMWLEPTLADVERLPATMRADAGCPWGMGPDQAVSRVIEPSASMHTRARLVREEVRTG